MGSPITNWVTITCLFASDLSLIQWFFSVLVCSFTSSSPSCSSIGGSSTIFVFVQKSVRHSCVSRMNFHGCVVRALYCLICGQ